MAKLITGTSNYQTEELNYEMLDKLTQARDHHSSLMAKLHEMKQHIHPDHHDEFNRHFTDMYNSFGRMKDLMNKNISTVK
jgi:hypothetical protein